MYLYAIKDLNTGLFVSSSGLNYRLKPLGVSTFFGKSRESLERCMVEKCMDITFNPITKELAWDEIESLYRLDRWNINISKEEFNEVLGKYDLRIVELYLGEIDVEETN